MYRTAIGFIQHPLQNIAIHLQFYENYDLRSSQHSMEMPANLELHYVEILEILRLFYENSCKHSLVTDS